MPLWRIFHPPGTLTTSEKTDLAKAITAIYTRSPGPALPAFYVNVFFVEMPTHTMYIGGEPRDNFVRVSIENISRKLPSDDAYKTGFKDRVDAVLRPFVAAKGFNWEFNVLETERDLWRIDGMDPPPPDSDEEKLWSVENRSVPRSTVAL